MERIEAELLTDGTNDAVLRLPNRNFPGLLIQGDTLGILQNDLAELVDLCATGDLEEAQHAANLLHADLSAKLERYTRALEAHGIPRPF
ncbi:hypothetical protein AB9128_12750 [Streptomyces cinereoruber]|uniref:DUF6959 family protein n=1 Tax=Streptomyces cinereoruber TaxID=67260 RepID=UPI003EBC6AFE